LFVKSPSDTLLRYVKGCTAPPGSFLNLHWFTDLLGMVNSFGRGIILRGVLVNIQVSSLRASNFKIPEVPNL
jgi:hypothetical protein